MKLKLLLVLFILLTLCVYAQEEEEETLVSFGNQNGGFGAIVTKMGKINDQFGALIGLRGGWIHNHSLILGGGIYSLTSDIKALNPNPSDIMMNRMQLIYGGGEIEYVFSPNNLIHWSLQTLFGGGGVSYHQARHEDNESHDAFFIIEPNININLNITHFFRIDFGISYRIIQGLNSNVASNSSLSGLGTVLTVKFGKF